MTSFRRRPAVLLRAVLLFAAGLSLPLLLTQCATKGYGTYQDIEYSPEKLATPAGHGMTKSEYPFDDDGKYRKDWVKNKSRDRVPSSYASYQPGGASSAPTSPSSSSPPAYVGTAPSASSSAVPPQAVPTTPVPASPPATPTPEARYHKVAKGDTLYSIATRHGASVASLKQVNGLSGDTIYPGQSLRLP